MSLLFILLGALLLVFAVLDLAWSTLSTAGGGPMSRRLGSWVWRLTGRLPFGGALVLLVNAVAWIGLLWAGWTLIFLGAPTAVVEASTDAPADLWGRVYFSGYTLATLGLGDVVPGGPVWRVLTALTAFSGLVLITLAVTYYMAVLGAVVHKQQIAALVHALGDSPAAVVAAAWDGDRFPDLDIVLTAIASQLALHARRHYAYPVVHYFGSSDPEKAFTVQAARLGDVLVLLRWVVAEPHRPAPTALRVTYRTLATVLETMDVNFVEAASQDPPLPDLTPLREAGIPLCDPEEAFSQDDVPAERRRLLGLVQDSGFRWQDVDPVVREDAN